MYPSSGDTAPFLVTPIVHRIPEIIHDISSIFRKHSPLISQVKSPKMADNISYKGYLKLKKNGEKEVRRFMISKDLRHNFNNLKGVFAKNERGYRLNRF